ncbi:electron transport complex, RnfABCDGE type, C subunit [Melioribacter roseus P3M-2]|uniref:Ion-translocating oxidoreductase complex subunit C n=1 Tax=Melioribacter roseus (strain DSM 23840 / JCM 17771 / VKM B-2668 / P3M-2) TaxID=1191523 RepID=I6ZRM5_MELRP|nr:electron transport complex subunit RsxC [Melioribacter roseus]AFN74719.1 electron transport complex, RnfABCDGE type, C subunit [Melioribacter roseus P3M-2]
MTTTFKGGVHPAEMKELTSEKPFEFLPLPEQICLPLSQHAGKQALLLKKKGDAVRKGEMIAEPDGFISAPIHSPVTGKINKTTSIITLTGIRSEAVIINRSDIDEDDLMEPLNPVTVAREKIIERVKQAGIVGQGGAAFPTYVKLSPPPDKKIDYVILNACECEPYLTRDYRFLIEKTEEVITGLKLILKAAGVLYGIIGVEDNKPEAIKKLENVLRNEENISLKVLKTKYPQGAEKMLIKAVTGREVPPGKLPFDVGCIIHNVGTAVSIYNAVVKGEPQINAFLTVSGLGIVEPKNLIVPVGTPLKNIIDYCGGIKENAKKIVAGGPMMGFAQFDLNSPVTKATSGILVLTGKEAPGIKESNCLNCGRCLSVCPLDLAPTRLYKFSRFDKFEEAIDIGLQTCMECGTCTYNCPAGIPLVQWIRYGKRKSSALLKQKTN